MKSKWATAVCCFMFSWRMKENRGHIEEVGKAIEGRKEQGSAKEITDKG